MTKRYCDECGKEMTAMDSIRLATRYKGLCVEVITRKAGGPWNTGDFCHNCIREALRSTAEEE